MSMPPGPGAARIHILLLDDHPVVTEGLQRLLDGHCDLEVVPTAATLEQALAATATPDVVVSDLVLGNSRGRGQDIVSALLARFPCAKVLVLTMVDDPSEVRAVLAAGARGFMVKDAAAVDLVDAVRRVAAGEDYLQPSVGAALAKAGSHEPPSETTVLLSEREASVARLLSLGHTNSEIAELLAVSQRTVESHRARLLDKLGVRSRAELVQRATELGLVDFSVPQARSE
jgi:two-component system, NarL family, response regulator NreC